MLLVKSSCSSHLCLVQVADPNDAWSCLGLWEYMRLLVGNNGLLLNKHFLIHLCLGSLVLLLLNLLLGESWLSQWAHGVLWLLGSRLCWMVVTLLWRASVDEGRPSSQSRWRQLHEQLTSSCRTISNRDMVLSCRYSLWSVLTSIYKNTTCPVGIGLRHQVGSTWGRLFSEIWRSQRSNMRMLSSGGMVRPTVFGGASSSVQVSGMAVVVTILGDLWVVKAVLGIVLLYVELVYCHHIGHCTVICIHNPTINTAWRSLSAI